MTPSLGFRRNYPTRLKSSHFRSPHISTLRPFTFLQIEEFYERSLVDTNHASKVPKDTKNIVRDKGKFTASGNTRIISHEGTQGRLRATNPHSKACIVPRQFK